MQFKPKSNPALKRRRLALLEGFPQIFNRRRVFISSLHPHSI